MAVAEEYGTGWRLLGSDYAPFIPHRQPAVEVLQALGEPTAATGDRRPWKTPQCPSRP